VKRIIKNVIVTLIIVGLSAFLLYLNSFRPRKINLTYDGVMYSKEAYLAKDYDNLDIKKIKLSIDGKITKRWFRTPSFKGRFDIDIILPNIDYVIATTNFYDHLPSTIIYYQQDHNSTTSGHYATAYYDGLFMKIYLELLEFTGYEGYSVVEPAQNIEDIHTMWGFLQKKYTPYTDEIDGI